MSAPTSNITPQDISDQAHAEGGPTKGSASAQMQSQATLERNAQQAVDQVAPKLESGQPVSHEEAQTVQSAEQKAMGGQRPPAGSVAAQAQSAADKQDAQGSASAQTGSASAQTQTQTTLERNAEEAVSQVAPKLESGQPVSQDEAHMVQSAQQKAMGGQRPPADSVAAQAQSAADKQENRGNGISATATNNAAATSTNVNATPTNPSATSTNTGRGLTPQEQSHLARERNLQEAIDQVGPKIIHDPKSVTQEDASLLESRERRAHGIIEKGSVAAVAQSLADKNAAAANTDAGADVNAAANANPRAA